MRFGVQKGIRVTFTNKYSEEVIKAILEEYHSGADRAKLCRKYKITPRTLFRWQEKAGENRPKLLRLSSKLHEENARLKRLLEEKIIENEKLISLLREKSVMIKK